MNKKLKGIIPPLVTPLLNTGTIDEIGLKKLIEHMIVGGVQGIFILGTTGEAQSLSMQVRKDLIEKTNSILQKRLPLLVGISDSSLIDSINLAEFAASHGADALVSAPPYYFKTSQSELIDFYQALIPQLPLPLFLYNMPTHTKVSFDPATILKIAEDKKVIGFKDSSANGAYLQSVVYTLRNRENFSIFVGPEEMTAESVLLGVDGGVNGGANMFPELYVGLYQAAVNGDLQSMREHQRVVMQISNLIYNIDSNGSSYLRGLKSALNVLGLCSDVPALPFTKLSDAERNKIEKAIAKVKISLSSLSKK